jgi:hypothetical protein
MIITRLAGGLGNQIFQLGASLLLRNKLKNTSLIIDDTHLSSYDVKRENELIHFFSLKNVSFKKKFLTKFRLPIKLSFKSKVCPFVGDKNFQYVKNNPILNNYILDGYFQESITQYDFNQEIMILKEMLKYRLQTNEDGCVIHIRGGDFVKLGWNSVTPKEYYIKAIQEMQSKYNQDKFYIVTDDNKYSQTILDEMDIKFEFIGNSMCEDFKLIGSFKHRILSSSTFALWASALGNNEESIVIAPKYWIPNRERKIFLPNETRIEF